MTHARTHARTHPRLKQKYIIVLFLISISSAPAQSFGETERRLVICVDFTVALSLRVGAVGEGDILV